MVELRILAFTALIACIVLFEWRLILSPRLLRLYFCRYSLRLMLMVTLGSAALFALLSRSPTPASDAAVLLVGIVTLGLGTCLVGFAYRDLFGDPIKRRCDPELRLGKEVRPEIRVKDPRHRNAIPVNEAPLIELDTDQPDET